MLWAPRWSHYIFDLIEITMTFVFILRQRLLKFYKKQKKINSATKDGTNGFKISSHAGLHKKIYIQKLINLIIRNKEIFFVINE